MAKPRFDYRRRYLGEHEAHPKRFSGKLSFGTVQSIRQLVDSLREARRLGPVDSDLEIRLLDWGSGKGYQYLRDRSHQEWGGILPYCYDIGVRQLWDKPQGKFDGIICTDVLEHIDKRDLPEFLNELFGYLYSDRPVFAYFNVSVRPAGKHFSDGVNMHLTVEPADWWAELLQQYWQTNVTLKIDYENKTGYNV